MSQLYPVHLGERDKYHVVEYPQGYSGLIRPDGSEVTSLTEPEDIHWHRELKPIHDELNSLHQQLATLTQERDALRDVVKELLGAGESISFYYSLHGKGCNCVPCMRIIRWKEVVNKVLLLAPSGEAGKGGEV